MTTSKPTLLYVDDEPINCDMFQINFRRKYKIITANSGKEGLEILESNSDISIIISDMKMPNMNGLEFIKTAKKTRTELKCYILSGFNITPEIKSSIEEGFTLDFFQKPMDIKHIEKRLQIN